MIHREVMIHQRDMLEQVMMLNEYKRDPAMTPRGDLLDPVMIPRGDQLHLPIIPKEDIDPTPRRVPATMLIKVMADKVLPLLMCREVLEMKFKGEPITINSKGLTMMHHRLEVLWDLKDRPL